MRALHGMTEQFVCQTEGGEYRWLSRPMHELSIMQSALSLALDQARQAGAARVHTIRLRIGALSGVVPDALEFAFEALTPGTLAEGAQLAIEPCARAVLVCGLHPGISV